MERTASAAGGRVRKITANLLALLVMGVAVNAARERSILDYKLVFHVAPRDIVPDGLKEQVLLVRSYVPVGAVIVYLMDKFEPWQFGLWERTLYPDYTIILVTGMKAFHSAAVQGEIKRAGAGFILSAGKPPLDPGFDWKVVLPPYPNGIPVILGRLRDP